MDATTIISLSALLLAVGTFVATQLGTKKTATKDYVEQLERRVATLERSLEYEKLRAAELEAENLRLMRLIVTGGKQ